MPSCPRDSLAEDTHVQKHSAGEGVNKFELTPTFLATFCVQYLWRCTAQPTLMESVPLASSDSKEPYMTLLSFARTIVQRR